jgi:hypothetical protein
MALEQILSVSGKSGLFRLIGQMKNGIIVESLSDGKRFPVHGAAKVSALEEISIYTDTDEVPLKDVFKAIYDKEGGKQALDTKATSDDVQKYFEAILPTYDRERVYASDMAKVIRWYNILIETNSYDPNAGEEAQPEAVEEKKEKKASAKKSAPKKASASSAKTAAPKKPAGGGKVNAPRKAGGSQRGS